MKLGGCRVNRYAKDQLAAVAPFPPKGTLRRVGSRPGHWERETNANVSAAARTSFRRNTLDTDRAYQTALADRLAARHDGPTRSGMVTRVRLLCCGATRLSPSPPPLVSTCCQVWSGSRVSRAAPGAPSAAVAEARAVSTLTGAAALRRRRSRHAYGLMMMVERRRASSPGRRSSSLGAVHEDVELNLAPAGADAEAEAQGAAALACACALGWAVPFALGCCEVAAALGAGHRAGAAVGAACAAASAGDAAAALRLLLSPSAWKALLVGASNGCEWWRERAAARPGGAGTGAAGPSSPISSPRPPSPGSPTATLSGCGGGGGLPPRHPRGSGGGGGSRSPKAAPAQQPQQPHPRPSPLRRALSCALAALCIPLLAVRWAGADAAGAARPALASWSAPRRALDPGRLPGPLLPLLPPAKPFPTFPAACPAHPARGCARPAPLRLPGVPRAAVARGVAEWAAARRAAPQLASAPPGFLHLRFLSPFWGFPDDTWISLDCSPADEAERRAIAGAAAVEGASGGGDGAPRSGAGNTTDEATGGGGGDRVARSSPQPPASASAPAATVLVLRAQSQQRLGRVDFGVNAARMETLYDAVRAAAARARAGAEAGGRRAACEDEVP